MPSLRISSRFLAIVGLTLTMLAGTPFARAQDVTSLSEPAHVAYVEGAATLERDGDTEAAAVNAPVVTGDRLRTSAGRIEVLFPDGTTLDLDEYSSADLLAPTLVRLVDGRAMLSVNGVNNPSGAVRYRVDTPVASIQTDGPGEFRISVLSDRGGDQTELAVMRGNATFATERGSLPLRAGERSMAFENSAPSAPQPFNAARFDDFDRWYAARHTARINPPNTQSVQYLPAELRTYGGTFDQYGTWQYTAPYGYVWYPSVVGDWQPYYYGYWSSVPTYGWTWIGVDRWSWPTHHFGRWGLLGGSWFWIPGRRWASAWVSWAGSPDYVSWCPLGFDERPVFGLSVGFASSRSRWIVVPRSSFGGRTFAATRYSIPGNRLPSSTRFVAQGGAPAPAPRLPHAGPAAALGTAVPRSPGRGTDSFGSVNGRRPSRDEFRGTGPRDQTPGPNTGDRGSAREFRRPLPDSYRGPTTDRSAPSRSDSLQAVPRFPQGEVRSPQGEPRSPQVDPRYRVPSREWRVPNSDGQPYRSAPPAGSRPETQPRYGLPSREWRAPNNDGQPYRSAPPAGSRPETEPRYRVPSREWRAPNNDGQQYRAAPPAGSPQYRSAPPPSPSVPTPQAVPRWSPQPREQGGRWTPTPPAAPPPARQQQEPKVERSYRSNDRAPDAQRPAFNPGAEARAPHGDRQSGENGESRDSRAVPRGEGSHRRQR